MARIAPPEPRPSGSYDAPTVLAMSQYELTLGSEYFPDDEPTSVYVAGARVCVTLGNIRAVHRDLGLRPAAEPVAKVVRALDDIWIERAADQARLLGETLRLALGQDGDSRGWLIREANVRLACLVSHMAPMVRATLEGTK